MALDNKTLSTLRKRLPRGFTTKALERLAANKKTFSAATVSRNLSGADYNEDVIDALIKVADEHQAALKNIKRRVRKLNRN